MPKEDFSEYKVYFDRGFSDLKKEVKDLGLRVSDLATEIAVQKNESKHAARGWAALTGALTSLGVLAVWYFLTKG
jgi:post-segregation antitoxin (ccd killing protein)